VNVQLILALVTVTGVTFLDWLLGILASLKTHTFSLQKLPGQLVTMILPYLGGSGLLVVIQGWITQYVGSTSTGGAVPAISLGAVYVALGAYALKVLSDVWTKILALAPTTTNPAPPAVPVLGSTAAAPTATLAQPTPLPSPTGAPPIPPVSAV